MNNKAHFSSEKSNWRTPDDLFKKLDKEFHFDLDACADKNNAKCKRYFSLPKDSCLEDGAAWNSRVFMNPPYGRKIELFIKKAKEQVENGAAHIVVGLLPARTDTKWFHDYILDHAEIRFLKGRLKFSGHKDNAPFPSMVVIWRDR